MNYRVIGRGDGGEMPGLKERTEGRDGMEEEEGLGSGSGADELHQGLSLTTMDLR